MNKSAKVVLEQEVARHPVKIFDRLERGAQALAIASGQMLDRDRIRWRSSHADQA